jgi:hypothetical protein
MRERHRGSRLEAFHLTQSEGKILPLFELEVNLIMVTYLKYSKMQER